MEYLHTMVRVSDIEQSLDFYCNKLGLIEYSRKESEKGRFTLIFFVLLMIKTLLIVKETSFRINLQLGQRRIQRWQKFWSSSF